MMALIVRTIARSVGLVSAVAGLLVSFQMSLVAVAASFEDGQDFEHLSGLVPAFLQHALGPALTSFGGLTTVGFYEPLIVILAVQVAIYLATEPAGDIESGLVDLVLARPLPRHRIMTRSLLVMSGAALLLPAIMAASLWMSLTWLAPAGAVWPTTRVVAELMANLVAVIWCFGGAGLAAAAWARRRAAAYGVVGVASVALYLADFVGDAWSRASWAAVISPFHRFHGAQIITGTSHTMTNMAVLVALGGIAVAAAYWKFQRRDV
jgi:ABC-2 type transport system permease protein